MCPSLKYTLIGICASYNGLSGANREKTVCCAKECGSCGGVGCGSRPGGPMSCCVSEIPESEICNTGDQYAPCTIQGVYRSYLKFKKLQSLICYAIGLYSYVHNFNLQNEATISFPNIFPTQTSVLSECLLDKILEMRTLSINIRASPIHHSDHTILFPSCQLDSFIVIVFLVYFVIRNLTFHV